ncbi:hypothetical protein [Catelliglobosispora koreensis]|uniref:hypothetical protein n=1 Tax=Catelliglobosispora koreensis TaxID=129052 RepID=UPI00036FE362|nr:hypothetical protein [Catelliglobosispora koreensis]
MAGRNEVAIDVVVRGEEKSKRSLKGIGDEAHKTGTVFGEMGKETSALSREMAGLEERIKNTAKAFQRTGADAFLADLRKDKKRLAELKRVDRLLLGDDDTELLRRSAQAGAQAGTTLVESFSKAISAGGSPVIAAAAAIGVALSPAIGASIGAAVIGSVGLGGIVGGVAAAARDESVKAAAKDFGQTFVSSFGDLGIPFVEPVVESLQEFRIAARNIARDLKPEFSSLANAVLPLARGFTEMIQNTLPGLKNALRSAEPVLTVLANALPGLGDDLSAMFDLIAEEPEGAAAAMHDLIVLVGDALHGFGLLVNVLSDAYQWFIAIGEVATGAFADMPTWLKFFLPLGAGLGLLNGMFVDTGDAVDHATNQMPRFTTNLNGIKTEAEKTADEMKALKNAIDAVFDPIMDLDEATVAYQKGLIALQKELLQGKRTLALTSEEGLRNRDAVLDQIQAIKDLRDATATVPEKVDEANAAYDRQLEALRSNLLALGFNKEEVNRLIDAYKGIPAAVTTEFKTPGLAEAIAQARILAGLLGSTSAAARARSGDSSGFGGGRAAGGPVHPNTTYVVGEDGPELLEMGASGGRVYSASQSRSMLAATAAPARPVVSIAITPSGNPAFDAFVQAIWPFILHQVRVDGGDLRAFGAA